MVLGPGSRPEGPDPGPDLSALGRRLVERTAGDVDAHALRQMTDEHVDRMPDPLRGPMRDLVSILVDHLGSMMATLRMQGQAAEVARQTREARLRLDPLPEILAKLGVDLPQPDRVEVAVDDGAFLGFNWHRLEKDATQCWRWAYPSLTGSVVLPRVNGGRCEVGVRFVRPFNVQPTDGMLSAMVDGVPVEFHERQSNTWIGSVTLPEDLAATRMALVITSAGHTDPRTGMNRDARMLGIGLSSVWVKRLSR